MEEWKLRPACDHGLPLAQSFKSVRRENGLIATGLHFTWWTMVRGYMRIWHRLSIQGRTNLPHEPPFVLAANHASHLDAFVLAASLPWQLRDRVFPIAAGDVFFETPVMTAFSAMFLNALPMWRKKCGPHTMIELRQRLREERCAYILFPEGSRSRDGKMAPFKKGLGMLVCQSDVPVVPCYLQGAFEALRPDQKFPTPRKICLAIGKPLSFSQVVNERAGWEQAVSEIEREVMALRDGVRV